MVALLAAAVACSSRAPEAAPPAAAQPASPPASDVATAGSSAGPPAAPTAGTTAGTPPPEAVTAKPPDLAFASASPPGSTAGQPAPPAAAPIGPAGLPTPAAAIIAPPVELLEAQALIPGAATALKPGEQIVVDPGATFRVVLKGSFLDARLSLLDGADAMQPSGGAREAGPATTVVTLQPSAPLKTGTAYRLRIDGATTRELKSKDGAVRGPIDLPILTAGDPPADPKPKAAKKPKKRP